MSEPKSGDQKTGAAESARSSRAEVLAFAAKRTSENESIPLPSHCELELADTYARAHGQNRKFIALWNKWLEWDGIRWIEDQTLRSYDLGREICKAAAKVVGKGAGAIAKAATVAAVERLTRADRAHAARAEQFDADPHLLNTPRGTIDLRTCELRPHRREDWLTKSTAVGPKHREPRRWREFLSRVTDGDGQLEAYLQRVVGYSLTGLTREHAFFFFTAPARTANQPS